MNASLESNAGHDPGFNLTRVGWGLVIIGIMAGVLFVSLANRNTCTETDDPKVMADLVTLNTQIVRYRTMAGSIPTQSQGLDVLVSKPTGDPAPPSWHQLMGEAGLVDPWGEPYQYRNPGKHNPQGWDIFSKGPDKREGTADDIYVDN